MTVARIPAAPRTAARIPPAITPVEAPPTGVEEGVALGVTEEAPATAG
jgi:hypothetical protein